MTSRSPDGPDTGALDRILDELRRLNSDMRHGRDDIWEAIDDLHVALERRDDRHGETVRNGRPTMAEYRRLRRYLRRMVETNVPEGASIAVVSRGDPELLEFPGREAMHYPLAPEGHYLGFYPPDGTPAIAHLEWVRAQGVRYLLLPATAGWWIDSFSRLASHLAETTELVAERADVGRLYDLAPEPRRGDVVRVTAQLADAWERVSGTAPSILDWSTGLELATRLPERTVFSPPSAGDLLPYLDGTADIVVVTDDDPARLAEARRVALRSVVRPAAGTTTPAGAAPGAASFEAAHVGAEPPSPASSSVVIPTYNGIRHLGPCLRALDRTLGRDFRGEVLVVDDGSGPATVDFLAEREAELPWLRVVRNDENLGFIGSCNRGASEAMGEVLVFLNDDTVPLDGWLDALLQVFERHPDAGAAGGRLVYPDGRLQEAGGVIYRDGSGANVGRGDWDPDSPMFTYLRPVDYCSGALLATPRHLFDELGGFDTRYRPAYYEDTDYCFSVRESGRTVYYQPESTIVHVEGATSGTDVGSGVKRYQVQNRSTFRRRWRSVLNDRRSPPESYGEGIWLELTRAGGR
jgi:GT2 family glycosyltransferase